MLAGVVTADSDTTVIRAMDMGIAGFLTTVTTGMDTATPMATSLGHLHRIGRVSINHSLLTCGTTGTSPGPAVRFM